MSRAAVLCLALVPAIHGAAQTQALTPLVIGEVRALRSAVLNEQRVLNVVLPDGYASDSAARYPVVVVLDGSADEDLLHVAGLVQFASMPWVGWLKPSIVVGIANVDRKRDLTFPTTIAKDKADFPTTGGSAAFLRFLADEVLPAIDSAYRTDGQRLLIGQSLGGLLATEALLTRPGLFSRYLIVSPSLWWDDGSLLRRHAEGTVAAGAAPQQVYIAVGKEGRVMEGQAKRLAALLRKDQRIRVGFGHLPRLDHATILHQAAMDGLRWMGKGR